MACTHFTPQIVGPQQAAYSLLSSRFMDGDAAKEAGLVLESLETFEVVPRAIEIAQEIARNSPAAVSCPPRRSHGDSTSLNMPHSPHTPLLGSQHREDTSRPAKRGSGAGSRA